MKISQKITTLFFLVITSLSAQKNVYVENFDSENSWPTGSDKIRELNLFNGRYYFEHKRTERFYTITTRTYNLNTTNDFEIETAIQKINGIDNSGISFLYDYKDTKNYREFGFTSNGYYRVAESKSGTYKNLQKWIKSDKIKTGNFGVNKLKISKKGNTVTFYINNEVVFTQNHESFMGNKAGITLYKNQKISIDYIKVTESENTNNNYTNIDNNNNFNSNNTVIYDNFYDNKNGWATQNNNEATLAVTNGSYEFDYKEKKGFTSSKTIDVDTNRDFKIEAKIKKLSGIQKNGFGITFGREDSKNQNQFIITASGYFAIDVYKNGQFISEVDWTSNTAIKKGNYSTNTLRIEKRGNTHIFFINNTKVHTAYNLTFYGKRYGFSVFDTQKIAIEYYTIAYLDNKSNNNKNFNKITNNDILFEDNFITNANNWIYKSDNEADFSIRNGKYYLKHKEATKGWNTTIDKPFDNSGNFEISAKIDKVSGVLNNPYGILWGKEGTNSFGFYLASSGYYKIVRIVNNKEEVITKWTQSSTVNKNNGASNIIKIKKEGTIYKYFINDTYVTKTDVEPFFGNRIGFVIYDNQEIAIDYLKVNRVKTNTNYITKNALSLPLYENFSSNTNSWILDDSEDYSANINNDKLQIHKKKKGGIFVSKEVNVDDTKDFIIETSIANISNSEAGLYGLTFGRKNSANEYSFLFSNGSYLYRKFDNSEYKKIIPFTESSAIKTGLHQFNALKIVKSGNVLRFYINNQYVNETPFEPFFGNSIGYTIYYDKKIAVDYLNVKYQTESFNTPPTVVITSPNIEAERGFKIVEAKRIQVTGHATDTDGIFEITVNGIEANVSEDGRFIANVPLKYGKNDLIVKATDLKQASSTKTFTIKRNSANTNTNTIITNNTNDKIDIGFGKYYALIIGVSDYEDSSIADLNGEPTKDAQALADVLTSKYSFNKENVEILKNPTDSQINRAFFNLRKKVTNKDNVLIFYAGHGNYDETSERGYWMPSNAQMEFEDNIILNTSIVSYIKAIKSKHTFLIADACFSGSIFKSRAYTKEENNAMKKYNLSSRKAITSGTLKTVPNKSIFIKYLLKRLEDNTEKYLSSSKLFSRIEDPVMNNSPNIPQRGVIHGAGDEGGDFIFIKK